MTIPPKHPPSLHVKSIAVRIIGTIGHGEILDEINELGIEDARALDSLALRCEGCEWWFARLDIVDDGVHYFCRECAKEHRHEEG